MKAARLARDEAATTVWSRIAQQSIRPKNKGWERETHVTLYDARKIFPPSDCGYGNLGCKLPTSPPSPRAGYFSTSVSKRRIHLWQASLWESASDGGILGRSLSESRAAVAECRSRLSS